MDPFLNNTISKREKLAATITSLGLDAEPRDLTDAKQARDNTTQTVKDLTGRRGDLTESITAALATGDAKTATNTSGELSAVQAAIEQGTSDEVKITLGQNVIRAVNQFAINSREAAAQKFNDHAERFTRTYREELGGGPVSVNDLISRSNGNKLWAKLTSEADQLNTIAGVIDTIAKDLDYRADDGGAEQETRYAVGLAYVNAGNLTQWDEYQWLKAPELSTMQRWLMILNSDSRTSEPVMLAASNFEDQQDEIKKLEAVFAAWMNNQAGHNHISTFAAEYWTKQTV